MSIRDLIVRLEAGNVVEIEEVVKVLPEKQRSRVQEISDKLPMNNALIYLLGSIEVFPDTQRGIEAIQNTLRRVPAESAQELSEVSAKRFYHLQMKLHAKRSLHGVRLSPEAYEVELGALLGEASRNAPSGNATPGYFGFGDKLYRTS